MDHESLRNFILIGNPIIFVHKKRSKINRRIYEKKSETTDDGEQSLIINFHVHTYLHIQFNSQYKVLQFYMVLKVH